MHVDSDKKLDILAADSSFEVAGSDEGKGARNTPSTTPCGAALPGITPIRLPGGRTMPLMKVLQSNACSFDCAYCPTRARRSFRRTTFQPEQLARLYFDAYRAGHAQGLFLSSAILGKGWVSMDLMLATADILRTRYLYEGYLHLKIMPGAQRAQVDAAVRLADRVSINLEAPTQASLSRLSGMKRLEEDILERVQWIHAASRLEELPAGHTTQFMVGAGGESDREILDRTAWLYRNVGLRRAYFSAFRPVPDTPLESAPPVAPLRASRLYQADYLFRRYGSLAERHAFDGRGNLPLDVDPKMAIALSRPADFPVEVNGAGYEDLLRIPGIGPLTARRILARRPDTRVRDLQDLQLLGAVAGRCAPFVLIDGRAQGDLSAMLRARERRSVAPSSVQLKLL